jgi:hypothetical protein
VPIAPPGDEEDHGVRRAWNRGSYHMAARQGRPLHRDLMADCWMEGLFSPGFHLGEAGSDLRGGTPDRNTRIKQFPSGA